MLMLCLFALVALAADTVVPLSPSTREILQWADTAVCGLFFIDFVIQLARARNRWQYFMRWCWIDLLSSIPMVEPLRVGRVEGRLKADLVSTVTAPRRRMKSTALTQSLHLGISKNKGSCA